MERLVIVGLRTHLWQLAQILDLASFFTMQNDGIAIEMFAQDPAYQDDETDFVRLLECNNIKVLLQPNYLLVKTVTYQKHSQAAANMIPQLPMPMHRSCRIGFSLICSTVLIRHDITTVPDFAGLTNDQATMVTCVYRETLDDFAWIDAGGTIEVPDWYLASRPEVAETDKLEESLKRRCDHFYLYKRANHLSNSGDWHLERTPWYRSTLAGRLKWLAGGEDPKAAMVKMGRLR